MPLPPSCSKRIAARGGDAARRFYSVVVLATALAAGAGFAGSVRAAPYRPSNPELVLLEVPARRDLVELRAAEGEYREAPLDALRLQRLIAAQLDAGRRYADPRYFGQAEALLVRWRADGTRLRVVALDLDWADVQQHRHDYVNARATLDDILRREPANAQAHLMRAQLGLAEGRLSEARSDCASLVRAGAVGVACLAQVIGMSGNLDRAVALMDRALATAPSDAAVRSWMLTARADMAARNADPRSLDWLRQALAADPDDQYARLAVADALIDAGDPEEATTVIGAGPRSDAALLRLAIIAARRGADDMAAAELAARFAEAEARGEQVHLRDLARFKLHALHDVRAALVAARENFHAQRERWDARILLEAAHAAGDRGAAREVVDWRRASGYEDRTLGDLFRWAEERG
jgi:predicted Zn-dependent protease